MKIHFGLVFITFLGGLSYGGVVNGGGGKGVKCSDRTWTLDLYEAHLKGWPKPFSYDDLESDLAVYGLEYLTHLSDNVDEWNGPIEDERILGFFRENILNKIEDIAVGQRLPLTNDATLPALPQGCKIVQLMVYSYVQDKIYRDREYWDQLSASDQASLVLHEAFYYRARVSGGATNSDEVREIVGRIFSRQEINPLFSPIWFEPSYLSCVAGTSHDQNVYEFFAEDAVGKEGRGVALYFGAIHNRYLISFTSAFALGVSTQSLLKADISSFQALATNRITGENWVLQIEKHQDSSVQNPSWSIRVNGRDIPAKGSCQTIKRKLQNSH